MGPKNFKKHQKTSADAASRLKIDVNAKLDIPVKENHPPSETTKALLEQFNVGNV